MYIRFNLCKLNIDEKICGSCQAVPNKLMDKKVTIVNSIYIVTVYVKKWFKQRQWKLNK